MATKVKPSRLQVSWTPQAWQVPVYVNEDTFQWWAWWGGWSWDVSWPSSSTDGDIALFDGATWKIIKDGWKSLTSLESDISANTTAISTINWKIPSAATSSNQLADKNYVNDSINSVTAYYITKDAQGNQWASYAELAAATTFYSWWAVRVPTRNDYTVVLDDETHNNATTRYSYQWSWWQYQYTVHDTPLTQSQLDALNSWITAAKVSTYDWYVYDIADKQDELVSGVNIRTINWTSILWSWDIVTPVWPTYSAWTWIGITNDTISNTWVTSFNGSTWAVTYTAPVTSVNWQTWAVTINEGKTKVFTLSSTSDLTNAQAAYDWFLNGGNPIIKYGTGYYYLISNATSWFRFTRGYASWTVVTLQDTQTWNNISTIKMIVSTWTITRINVNESIIKTSNTVPSTADNWIITLVV